jgi:peroxiredoxin family protein
MLAAILESGDLPRLYTGLSLLVSAASEGREVRGLASFGALVPLLDPQLQERALDEAPSLDTAEREAFARTLVELRAAAAPHIWACAAAVQATGASWEDVGARLAGVMSTPQFLREVGDGQLVVV